MIGSALSSSVPRRKYSLHSSLLLSDITIAKRRLSNVSDVVTRKLSSTIGWKTPTIPIQDILTQGKCLCGQYIRLRLKRSGVFSKKLALQRLRSIIGTPSMRIVRQVFPVLNYMGVELEKMYPKLYTNVIRQISGAPGGKIEDSETLCALLSTVARDLFRIDVTWGKVISLFAIIGGLAVDCVRQGHEEYLPKLIEGISDVIEDELVVWLNENGGWIGLTCHFAPKSNTITTLEWTILFLGCLLGIMLLYFILKFIGFCIMSNFLT